MKGGQMLLEIIKELRASTSRLHKESVLRRHKDNAEWKNYLLAVYNPYVVYRKKGDPNGNLDDLENLKLLRNIHAGVGIRTINTIYPNLIPAFQPMKAGEIGKQFKLESIQFPCIGQIKYDGYLTTTIVKNGEVTHYTSTGHPWKHEINYGLEQCPDGAYISELLCRECRGKLGDRRYAAIQTTFRTNTAKGIPNTIPYKLKVFDYIPLEDFYKGKCSIPYVERIAQLPYKLRVVPVPLDTPEDAIDFLTQLKIEGFEGIVLKQKDMEWRASTSRKRDFVKLKQRITGDFYVEKEQEGEGRLQGKIGGLVISDCDGTIVGVVGSGLTDADRNHWKAFVGRVVEIEYEQIMDNKLIQPTFKGIRDDKCGRESCDCIHVVND